MQLLEAEHALLHLPQLAGSLCRSLHLLGVCEAEPHQVFPWKNCCLKMQPHWPPRQNCPAPHARPQKPQSLGSAARDVQPLPKQKVESSPLQKHCPLLQKPPGPQALEHVPQFLGSVRRFLQALPHRVMRCDRQAHPPPGNNLPVGTHGARVWERQLIG